MGDEVLRKIERMKEARDVEGLRELADWGDPQASQALESVLEGDHVRRIRYATEAKDVETLRGLAAGDDPDAWWGLAALYWGAGELDEAVRWGRRAAERGNIRGQLLMAWMHMEECAAKTRPDDGEAVKWLTRAAEQGDLGAQYDLGRVYSCRHLRIQGLPSDPVRAAKWFGRAAAEGHPAAQSAMGICYHDGFGVPMDQYEAVRWWQRAAEKGIAPAAYNLGYCYHAGEGVPASKEQAISWFRKTVELYDDPRNRYRRREALRKDAQEALRLLQRPGLFDLFRKVQGPFRLFE